MCPTRIAPLEFVALWRWPSVFNQAPRMAKCRKWLSAQVPQAAKCRKRPSGASGQVAQVAKETHPKICPAGADEVQSFRIVLCLEGFFGQECSSAISCGGGRAVEGLRG